MEFTEEQVIEIVKKHLETLDFLPEDKVVIVGESGGRVNSVFYRTSLGDIKGTTHFYLQFANNGICYLENIELEPELRGIENGKALYRAIENIARDLGFKKINQFPVGTTYSGRSRRDYLIELGYTPIESFDGEERGDLERDLTKPSS